MDNTGGRDFSLRDAVPALLWVVVGILSAAFSMGGFSMPLEGNWVLVVAALVAHGAAVALFVWWVRGRAKALEKLLIFFLLGAFGSMGAGPGLLVGVNAWSDASVREQSTELLAVREHTARGTTRYYATLSPFPPLSEAYETQVDSDQYATLKSRPKRARVSIRVGAGRLGIAHLPLVWGKPYLRVE